MIQAMKPLLTLTVVTLVLCNTVAAERLYLALSQDARVDVFDVNQNSGELTKLQSVKLQGSLGPMCFSPKHDYIYVATTSRKDNKPIAEVVTLKRASDGQLEKVGQAQIHTRAPYVRASNNGKFLLAAHYGTGEVTVYRIENGICTDDKVDHHKTFRTAHCIELSPDGTYAYVPHTTPNRVYQFRFDQNSGKLTPLDPPFVNGPEEGHSYHQPRHYAHHPKLHRGYTSNERGGGISVWDFDTKTGKLKLLQTVTSLPDDSDKNSAAADIQITPDGRFAYVSNRDLKKVDPDKGDDTLAGFAIDPKSGSVKPIGHFPTEHFPRTFCINQSGKFVYSGGQKSGHLQAYRIQPDGKLKPLERYDVGRNPIWVMTK